MQKKRVMNSQRFPDPTRNGDILREGRVTGMSAEEILRELEEVECVYQDSEGNWKVVPGEKAWFECGLEEDEFMTPEFKRELEKLKAIGVEVIVNTAAETKIDWCDPTYGTGTINN